MNQKANNRENKAKNCFLENTNKIENSLVRLIKQKRTQITNVRNEKGTTTAGATDLERMAQKQFYSSN